MKGCMNCGNISCGNNKKRDCAGCGRWISPEDKIAELEEKVGMAERTRDRLKAMGFPTLASCKEYSAKLETLEKENERLTVDYETLKLHDEEEIGVLKSENAELKKELEITRRCWYDQKNISLDTNCKLHKAKELLKDFLLMAKVEHLKDRYETVDEAEQFLKESEK